MQATTYPATTPSSPTTGGYVGAALFWLVGGVIGLLCAPLKDMPGWLWGVRIALVVAGIGLTIGLIKREKSREALKKSVDRDAFPFDYWTIAHTTAGLVMGAWSIPFPAVIVFTIAWEVFEYYVRGFGETEVFTNRWVDVAFAWVGWILVAGTVALATHTKMPWLLPVVNSVLGPLLR